MRQADEQLFLRWNPPAAGPPEWAGSEVHVWRASVQRQTERLSLLRSPLSREELDRAAAYSLDVDRRRSLIARGILRQLLGRYLGQSPDQLKFLLGPFGKPSLPSPCPLQFNVTHGGDWIVFAFAPGRRVGIDVEPLDAEIDLLKTAAEFCSPAERQALARENGEARRRRFYQLWTRKESLLKAMGEGLSRSPAELNALEGVEGWEVRDIALEANYAAALAAEGAGLIARGWDADELIL